MPTPKDLFLQALDRPAPDRAAFLDEACGTEDDLRRRVEALLRAHDASDVVPVPGDLTDTEDRPTGTTRTFTPGPPTEAPGTRIGPYKLLQEIGEGGMGTVFMAEQTEPVRRRVALKVIKAGMNTAQVIARFEAERQALAIMDHPGIARVLDAGATDSGRPYFVMELVQGVPITRYCDDHRIAPRERLELMAGVCQAIQHAHQKGIIHRDIKPSNVLVTEVDGKAVPKVIDFGVAKATNQVLTEKTLFTQFGAIVGTPEYMSPEQAGLGSVDVDTRSDIYSLGVLLYELLTGSTPLSRESLREAAFTEVLRRIKEEEPPAPSSRLSSTLRGGEPPQERGHPARVPRAGEAPAEPSSLATVAAQRNTEPARLARFVRGELDWIVMKALEKDRTRRYETATGFAKDIRRYLDGDPVEAGPPSASYKLRKFARKHRAALATVGAFAALLIVATATSAGLAVWANRERERAEKREQMAIDAVKRFGDVVRETPELKNNPALAPLRATLLNEPLAFFKGLRNQLQADRDTRPESLARLAGAAFELGLLTDEIGDKRDARQAYEESLAILQALVRDHPTTTAYAQESAKTHTNLGILLSATGDPRGARQAYEAALAIQRTLARDHPTTTDYAQELAVTHTNLGILLRATGDPRGARQAYEAALAIQQALARDHPTTTDYAQDLALTHHNLGTLLRATGDPRGARQAHEAALAILQVLARDHPTTTAYASDLGATLNDIATFDLDDRRWTEARAHLKLAITWQKQALAANPKNPTYRQFLGSHLTNLITAAQGLGDDDEAAEARRELEELAASDPALVALDARLAAVLNGEAPKDDAERLALAYRAYEKALHAASARLYAEALEADPKLADDRQAQHRYNAACAAALAATGKGNDDPPPDDAAKDKLRAQALDWLKAELSAWEEVARTIGPGNRESVAKALTHWKQDPDLAGLRDADDLAKLPEAERQAFQSFWSHVDALLEKAAAPG